MGGLEATLTSLGLGLGHEDPVSPVSVLCSLGSSDLTSLGLSEATLEAGESFLPPGPGPDLGGQDGRARVGLRAAGGGGKALHLQPNLTLNSGSSGPCQLCHTDPAAASF